MKEKGQKCFREGGFQIVQCEGEIEKGERRKEEKERRKEDKQAGR